MDEVIQSNTANNNEMTTYSNHLRESVEMCDVFLIASY